MRFGQLDATTAPPRRSRRTMLSALAGDYANRVTASTQPALNTLRAELDDGGVIWVLHDTIVFQRHANGAATLSTGGWNTRTTRDRINMALRADGPPGRYPASVFTSRGTLYLRRWDGTEHAFHSRITMGPRGGDIKADHAAKAAEYINLADPSQAHARLSFKGDFS